MAKPYGLANQKLCDIQMLLNIELFGEFDFERSYELLVNTDPVGSLTKWILWIHNHNCNTLLLIMHHGNAFIALLPVLLEITASLLHSFPV